LILKKVIASGVSEGYIPVIPQEENSAPPQTSQEDRMDIRDVVTAVEAGLQRLQQRPQQVRKTLGDDATAADIMPKAA
jgi:hypothetical protein